MQKSIRRKLSKGKKIALIITSVIFVIVVGFVIVITSRGETVSQFFENLNASAGNSSLTNLSADGSILTSKGGVITTGTFIGASDINSEADINKYLDEMSKLRIDTVIIQSTKGEEGTCENGNINVVWKKGMPGVLSSILSKAKAKNINVYVGLLSSDVCGYNAYSDPNKSKVISEMSNLVDTILARTQGYSNFKGWYIPDEPAVATWQINLTTDYYQKIVSAIVAKSNLPIIISPYLLLDGTNPATPQQVASKALEFQNGISATVNGNTSNIIQAWQDSVGADSVKLNTSGSSLRDYFSAISAAIGKDHFWSNNELFTFGTSVPTYSSSFYKPTSFTRLMNQYENTAGIASKYIVYQQPHQLSTVMNLSYNNEALRLTDEYMAYFRLGTKKYIKPLSYKWIGIQPNSTYPDTGTRELIDSKIGNSKEYYAAPWIGFFNVNPVVEMRLAERKNIRWVGFHVMSDSGPAIQFPKTLNLSCKLDTGDWKSIGSWALQVTQEKGEYFFANKEPLNNDCSEIRAELIKAADWKWIFISEVEIVTNN